MRLERVVDGHQDRGLAGAVAPQHGGRLDSGEVADQGRVRAEILQPEPQQMH